jgi:hypothetical protein
MAYEKIVPPSACLHEDAMRTTSVGEQSRFIKPTIAPMRV